MGAALSNWLHEHRARGGWDHHLELKLASALALELQAQKVAGRRSRTRNLGSAGALRPVDVVTDEVAARLDEARRSERPMFRAYFERAFKAEIEVDQLECTIKGIQYSIARITLTEPASAEERVAMEKAYPSRKDAWAGKLAAKRAAVLERIGGVGKDYLLVDASGCAAAVVARNVFSAAGLLGKRVLLCLNVILGLDEGYMKVCAGSGAPEACAMRERMRHERSLMAWGLPAGAAPVLFALNGSTSGRLHYGTEGAEGATDSFQCGSWLARREITGGMDSTFEKLHAAELGEYEEYVIQYLHEARVVLDRYGPLLLCGGYQDVTPAQLPDRMSDGVWDSLSFLTVDSWGKSRLAIHDDTDQVAPCLCSCDSMYPPGFYDYVGGELFFAEGLWAEWYGREDAVLLMGHETPHTVLNLAPPPNAPGGERKPLPMLRASIVHWSNGGKKIVEERHKLIHDERGCSGGGSMWEQARDALDVGVRTALGKHEREEPPPDMVFRPEAPHVVDVVGPVGMRLRLRGGKRKKRKKKVKAT